MSDHGFTETTFDLLARLHATPTASLYLSQKEAFKAHVERPLQALFRATVARLPRAVVGVMETEKNVFARIIKNDFGRGGAWDYYWGALYPRGGRRIMGVQLFLSVGYDGVRAGLYVAPGSDQRARLVRNCRRHAADLPELLAGSLADHNLAFGEGERGPEPAWRDWLRDPEAANFVVMAVWPGDRVLRMDAGPLSDEVAQVHARLFPVALLALEDEPLAEIEAYLRGGDVSVTVV